MDIFQKNIVIIIVSMIKSISFIGKDNANYKIDLKYQKVYKDQVLIPSSYKKGAYISWDLLSLLAKHSPCVVSYDNISLLTSNLGKLINNIKNTCGNTRVIQTIEGVGCCLNVEEIDFTFEKEASLKLDYSFNQYDLLPYYEDSNFVVPQSSFDYFASNAFLHSNICVLCGQHGAGKSTFASYFARYCIEGQNIKNKLRFKSVVRVVCDHFNLRQAIASLKLDDDLPKDLDPVEFNLMQLEHVSKPCLLIIDNYDYPTGFQEDFSIHNQILDWLRRIDQLFVLVTSNNYLTEESSAYKSIQFDNFYTEDELYNIFAKTASTYFDGTQEKQIRTFIKDTLGNNVYLCVLTAKLLSTKSLDTLLRVNFSSTTPVSSSKDGITQTKTILHHFEIMYSLQSFEKSEDLNHLVGLLSLIPESGMPYDFFFENAFEEDKKEDMERLFSILKENYWVFEENHNIIVKPIVKELFALHYCDDYSFFEIYIASLNKICHTELYTKNLYEKVCYATAAYHVLSTKSFSDLSLAMLCVYIVADYDILKRQDLSILYVEDAFQRLESCKVSAEKSYELAVGYNLVGNALVHLETKPTFMQMTFDCFNKAEELLKNDTSLKARILLEKIQGNRAAYYLHTKHFELALKAHQKTLSNRYRLYEEAPSANILVMIAYAYKGIGTDYYHLSKTQDNLEYLKESILNNFIATTYFDIALKEYPNIHKVEYYLIDNRYVGSALAYFQKINSIDDHSYFELLSRTKQDIDFFAKIQNKKECDISRQHLKDLKELESSSYSL